LEEVFVWEGGTWIEAEQTITRALYNCFVHANLLLRKLIFFIHICESSSVGCA